MLKTGAVEASEDQSAQANLEHLSNRTLMKKYKIKLLTLEFLLPKHCPPPLSLFFYFFLFFPPNTEFYVFSSLVKY